MDENNRKRKSRSGPAGIAARKRVVERDEIVPSPEARAGYLLREIQKHFPNLNNWDLICFCAEFLGSQLQEYPWLEQEAVVMIARRVNFAHYEADEPPESGIGNVSAT